MSRKIFKVEWDSKVPRKGFGMDMYNGFIVVAANEQEARREVNTIINEIDQPHYLYKFIGVPLASVKSGIIMSDFTGV